MLYDCLVCRACLCWLRRVCDVLVVVVSFGVCVCVLCVLRCFVAVFRRCCVLCRCACVCGLFGLCCLVLLSLCAAVVVCKVCVVVSWC